MIGTRSVSIPCFTGGPRRPSRPDPQQLALEALKANIPTFKAIVEEFNTKGTPISPGKGSPIWYPFVSRSGGFQLMVSADQKTLALLPTGSINAVMRLAVGKGQLLASTGAPDDVALPLTDPVIGGPIVKSFQALLKKLNITPPQWFQVSTEAN